MKCPEKDSESIRDRLSFAFSQLNRHVPEPQIQELARLIHQGMTGSWRYFHTPDHSLEVGGSKSPIEILAGLFHDIVYLQIDHSINLDSGYYVAPFVTEENGSIVLRRKSRTFVDATFELVCAIFGLEEGQTLDSTRGQNEFLSAVVAAKSLGQLMHPGELAQIVACIEATIPFRSRSADGQTALDRLRDRLVRANAEFDLNLGAAETDQALRSACHLANRDVGGFGSSSPAIFLDNTWQLIPETNHVFTSPGSYTITAYRGIMQKMLGFLNFLQPDAIFQQYHGEPSDEVFRRLSRNASMNLEVGRLYLRCKLSSLAVLEAISRRVGTNTPLAMLMGELPGGSDIVLRMETFLPRTEPEVACRSAVEEEVLRFLREGRTAVDGRDKTDSPVAYFMLCNVGFERMRAVYEEAAAFFGNQMSGEMFLSRMPSEVTTAIMHAVAQLFRKRAAFLEGAH